MIVLRHELDCIHSPFSSCRNRTGIPKESGNSVSFLNRGEQPIVQIFVQLNQCVVLVPAVPHEDIRKILSLREEDYLLFRILHRAKFTLCRQII